MALDFQRSVDALQERAAEVISASADSIANCTVLAASARATTPAAQATQQNGTNGVLQVLLAFYPVPSACCLTSDSSKTWLLGEFRCMHCRPCRGG